MILGTEVLFTVGPFLCIICMKYTQNDCMVESLCPFLFHI